MVAQVFSVKSLEGKLPMSSLTAASPLRNVRIVPPHSLSLEHLKLGIDAFQFGLIMSVVVVTIKRDMIRLSAVSGSGQKEMEIMN